MTKNKRLIYAGLIIGGILLAALALMKMTQKPSQETMETVSPELGSIQTVITSTATVQPQNRLEIKPPINGRIEQILVKEGETVKVGQILVWMSSTERAAL
ncbi:MAG: efflux RND transporter periplasmic adaptor subunit, partial [Candidatus Omnitrophica bacterium]|nr:efflux RND transporter periplasmic adaptor subunit [Candidatus Omnitrophota bacterium]